MHYSPSKEGQCYASDEQQVALVEASNTNDGSRLTARDAVAHESEGDEEETVEAEAPESAETNVEQVVEQVAEAEQTQEETFEGEPIEDAQLAADNDDVQTLYSESIATAISALEDDASSTCTEGSTWGDDFSPWELQVKSNEFTVRDLVTMRKEYQFRVVALNKVGRSQPSKPSEVCQPRPDQKRPSPPRALKNLGTTPSSISLEWDVPETDGGAPILGYAVQMRAGRSKQWKEIAVDVKETNLHVPDLTEGMDYIFRVHCYNIVGISDWHENLDPITAKCMFDPPGVPRSLRIMDITAEAVELKWREPIFNGGTEITDYCIERQDKGTPKWKLVSTVPGDETEGNVTNLRSGREYKFRVVAYNCAGMSQPSDASAEVEPKDPDASPWHKISAENVTLIAGQKLRIRVPFGGSPMPTLTWHPRPLNLRSSLQQYDENIRADTALLSNRPGAPQNLEIGEVTKSTCKLIWSPPQDDGGCPIEYYSIFKQEEGRRTWGLVNPEVTKCEWKVEELITDTVYTFKIVAHNKVGAGEPLISGENTKAIDPVDPPEPPQDLISKDITSSSVTLRWSRPDKDGGAAIIGYCLEFARKGYGKLIEGKDYEFRIASINREFHSKWAYWPTAIRASDPLALPQIEVIKSKETQETFEARAGRDLKIECNVFSNPYAKVSCEAQPKLLETSDKVTVSQTKKDSKNGHSELIVKNCTRKHRGRYLIIAENNQGRNYVIVNMNVLDVPGVPQEPWTYSDPWNNAITLEWNEPEDDGGAPILGYYLEKKSDQENEWSPLTTEPIKECQFNATDLKEHAQATFRVKTVNKAGESEPALIKEVVAKDRFEIPLIKLDEEFERETVRHMANNRFWLKASVSGRPFPEIIIKHGDKILDNENAPEIEISTDQVTGRLEMYIRRPQRSHHGNYKITARNCVGSKNVTTNLNILDVASPPEHARPATVTKDFIQVAWNKPQDNGGSLVTEYIVERRDMSMHAWLPCDLLFPSLRCQRSRPIKVG
ncbi:unnamed protein product [Oikopleura dioica]|uniref:Fibronectin type-III domain-containing protein n=1 Tax=Oikopleura dioica TaxID=34765 RepID=E4XFI2_OIKDI|nr:unnamed protein product [Oikopleura dioica]